MYYFCMTVLVFLAVVGLCAVARSLSSLLCRETAGEIIILSPMSGHREDAEYVLRSAVRRAKLWGCPSVICVDDGMDAETRRVCPLASRDCPMLRLCRREELSDIVNNL